MAILENSSDPREEILFLKECSPFGGMSFLKLWFCLYSIVVFRFCGDLSKFVPIFYFLYFFCKKNIKKCEKSGFSILTDCVFFEKCRFFGRSFDENKGEKIGFSDFVNLCYLKQVWRLFSTGCARFVNGPFFWVLKSRILGWRNKGFLEMGKNRGDL